MVCANDYHQLRHGRSHLLLPPWRKCRAQDIQFFAYTIAMLVLLGEMLVETNVKSGVIEALRALPSDHLSRPTAHYLAVFDSWVALTTRITFNLSVWLLWLGVFYLLFLWKRHSNQLDSG